MTDPHQDAETDDEALELSDLLSHVLDKGVVITGDVIISVAGIDLISVSLGVLITAIETIERRRATTVSARLPGTLGLPVLPPARDG
jgi:hypothetical protein